MILIYIVIIIIINLLIIYVFHIHVFNNSIECNIWINDKLWKFIQYCIFIIYMIILLLV